MKVKALNVSVYENPTYKGCSNGGVSSIYWNLLLIGDGVEGPKTVDLDHPANNVVKLIKRTVCGEEYMHVEPLDGCNNGGDKWYMSGGAFCYSSDSRFPSKYPLSIHDRCEQ